MADRRASPVVASAERGPVVDVLLLDRVGVRLCLLEEAADGELDLLGLDQLVHLGAERRRAAEPVCVPGEVLAEAADRGQRRRP